MGKVETWEREAAIRPYQAMYFAGGKRRPNLRAEEGNTIYKRLCHGWETMDRNIQNAKIRTEIFQKFSINRHIYIETTCEFLFALTGIL